MSDNLKPGGGTVSNPAVKKSTLAWRPDIDGLRALAVFAVFVFHAFPTVPYFKGGFVGVDFFFVISGFLISSIIYTQLAKGTFSFWDFYSRRIRRIYPVLLTVLAGCLGFGWFYLLADEYMQLGKHVAGGAGFVSNFVLFLEKGYFDNASATKPLLHFWSLGVEEQFYIFWPLILWLTWKLKKNAMFWVALVIAVISMAMNLYWYKSNPSMDYFLPHTRVWELLCGAMLAWGNLNWKEKVGEIKEKFGGDKLNHVLSVIGFGLLIVSILFSQEKGYPGWQAIVPIVATVLVIMAGKDGFFNRWVLSNKVLVWFGLISYPMYLWHWPLISMRRIVTLEAPSTVYCVGAFVACTVLAWLTTKFIEHPLRFGGYGKAKTVGLFLVMMAMGGTGYLIFAKEGLAGRFPEDLRSLQEIINKGRKNNSGFNDMKTGAVNPCHSFWSETALKKCKNTESRSFSPEKKNIVIWGDSHAGHLVPGFIRVFGDGYNVMQRTGGRCPAIGNPRNPSCLRKTEIILADIIREKPEMVVLAAAWLGYKDMVGQSLEKVVGQLRDAGIKDIVLIGPVPYWKASLPKIMVRTWLETHQFPDAADNLRVSGTFKMDERMSEISQGLAVRYVSPVRLLCDGSHRCLTMVSAGVPETVFAFDNAHLTNFGSEYLVSKMKNELVPDSARHR